MVVHTYVKNTVGSRLPYAWCDSKKIKKVCVRMKSKKERQLTIYNNSIHKQ